MLFRSLAVDGSFKSGNPTKLGLLGDISFFGFSKVGTKIMARANTSNAFVAATGDVGQAKSWSVGSLGKTPGGLNRQIGIGTKDDRSVLFVDAYVTESLDDIGAGALWEAIWSPEGSPSGWYQLWRDSNKTLCSSVAGETKAGFRLSHGYVAPDLSIIAYMSSGGIRVAPEKPGVCLSTDGGKLFYRSELAGLDDEDTNNENLNGVTCISSNTCFAFSGSYYRRSGTRSFIYYTTDAQKGVKSTWTSAKLPTMPDQSVINNIFFAPDGKNGWAVGAIANASPLLLNTTDGGLNWKNTSSSIRALAPNALLLSGYAFDANNVWLGGDKDTLLTTTK